MAKAKKLQTASAADLDELVLGAAYQDYTTICLMREIGQRIRQREADKARGLPITNEVNGQLPVPTFVPGMVNSALSIEMYLKCIAQVDAGAFPRTHDLVVLFNNLKRTRQTRINDLLKSFYANDQKWAAIQAQYGSSVIPTVSEILTKGKDAFVEWRYFFEIPERERSIINFEPLRVALRTLIQEINPKWGVLLASFGPLPELHIWVMIT